MKCNLAKTEEDYKFLSHLYRPANTKFLILKKRSVKQLKKMQEADFRYMYVVTVGNIKVGSFSLRMQDKKIVSFGMVIDAKFQGKGYGTQMMKLIEKESKKLGANKITLQVYEKNLIAKKLYSKNGYKETRKLLEMEKSI